MDHQGLLEHASRRRRVRASSVLLASSTLQLKNRSSGAWTAPLLLSINNCDAVYRNVTRSVKLGPMLICSAAGLVLCGDGSRCRRRAAADGHGAPSRARAWRARKHGRLSFRALDTGDAGRLA